MGERGVRKGEASDYSQHQVLVKAVSLCIWRDLGYKPTLSRYNMWASNPSEAEYIERLFTHLSIEAIGRGGSRIINGQRMTQAKIKELAIDEYFRQESGTYRAVTMAVLRLEGELGFGCSWEDLTEKQRIRGLSLFVGEG